MLVRKLIIAAFIGLLACSPAAAFLHRGGGSSPLPPGPSGISQENIGGNDNSATNFTNLLKAVGFDYGFSGSNTPQMYDGSQYPQATLSSTAQGQVFGTYASQEYKLSWPATRSTCKFNLSGPVWTLNASSNATTSGFGSSNSTITCDGVHAGFVQVTCTSGCSNWFFQTVTTGTFAPGSGEWIMCRDSNNGGAPNDDCSQYALAESTGGKQGSFWTPEYVAAWNSGRFNANRSMGLEITSFNSSQAVWGYRPQVGWFTWNRNNPYRMPRALAGGAANTNSTLVSSTGSAGQAPIILTAAPSDDQNAGLNSGSLGAWKDGETIIATTPSAAAGGFYLGNVTSDGTTNCSSGPCVVLSLAESSANTSSSGTTITVSSPQNTTAHPITVGMTIFGPTWATATITGSALSNPAACSPNCTGSGAAGTYAISVSQTVSGGSNNSFFVNPSDVSSIIAANNVVFGAQITGTTEANGVQTVSAVSGFQLTTTTKFVHSGFSPGGEQACIGIQQLLVTGKSGGPVFLTTNGGVPYGGCNNSSFTVPASTVTALTYSSAAGAIVSGTTGFPGSIPWEAIINFSNVTNSGMWANIWLLANDDYLNNLGALTASNLNSNLFVVTELENEIWSNSFADFFLASQMASGLGIAAASFDELSFQGLRSAMIAKAFKANGWSSRTGYLAGMFNQHIAVSNYQGRMWNGTSLSPTNNAALCAYEGGAFSGTCSGAIDYSAVGTRPVDVMDVVGQAIYGIGNYLCGADGGCTYSTQAISWYKQQVAQWILNDSTDQNAVVQLIDYDMRGQSQIQNPSANSNPNYTFVSCSGSPGTWNFGSAVAGTNGSTLFGFTTTGTFPSTITDPLHVIGTSPGVYQISSGAGTTAIQLKSETNGVPSSTAINCGSAGTGTLTMYPIGTNNSLNMYYNSTWYSGSIFNYDQAAASYTSARSGFSPAKAPLQVRWYEGGMEQFGSGNFNAANFLAQGIFALPAITPIHGTTNGSTIVSNVDVNGAPGVQGIYRGQTVSAGDIASTVASVNTGCTAPCFTLANSATGSNSGETITFTDPNATAAFNAITDAIFAYKNSSLAKATMIAFYQSFMGTDPAQPWTYGQMTNSTAPSNLVLALTGGTASPTANPWALYPGDITSTPFKTRDAVCDFNGGSC